jgi:acyl carrier protein
MNTAIELLMKVLHVVDTTDPESEAHLDSGADSLDILLEMEEDIRDFIYDQTGTYPSPVREQFDFNAEKSPVEWE